MSEKKRIIIATVRDLDVFFSNSVLAERHVTHHGAQMSVARSSEQASLQDIERPMAKVTLLLENENAFIPLPVSYAATAMSLLLEFEKIMDIDTTKKHAITGRKELLALLAGMETVFYGSEVVGPDILLPA